RAVRQGVQVDSAADSTQNQARADSPGRADGLPQPQMSAAEPADDLTAEPPNAAEPAAPDASAGSQPGGPSIDPPSDSAPPPQPPPPPEHGTPTGPPQPPPTA